MHVPTYWPLRSAGPDLVNRAIDTSVLRIIPGCPRFQLGPIRWLSSTVPNDVQLTLKAELNKASANITLPTNLSSPIAHERFDFCLPPSTSENAYILFALSLGNAPHSVVYKGLLSLFEVSCDAELMQCTLRNTTGAPVALLYITCLRVTPHAAALAAAGTLYKRPFTPRFSGHRGIGPSGSKAPWRVMENSIESFMLASAFETPVKTVELDVQLTADGRTIVFHDWFFRSREPNGHSDPNSNAIYSPVYDLTFAQMDSLIRQSYKCPEPYPESLDRERLRDLAAERQLPSNLFDIRARSLRDVLESLPADIGVFVELKYPSPDVQADLNLPYPERDALVNAVLDDIFASIRTKRRSIAFLCFEPDICDMLALKQNSFPVYFSHCEALDKPCDEFDPRTINLPNGLDFVKNYSLDGLMLFNQLIRERPEVVQQIVSQKIPIITYGDTNCDSAFVEEQFDAGVSGVIADDIHVLLKDLSLRGSFPS